jgi:phage gpG-like protein
MSFRLTLEKGTLPAGVLAVHRLADLDEEALMTDIAFLGENQTRRRIESEKASPDGEPWKPNRQGTSILLDTGRNLRDSVASRASAAEAEWGASWEFAHVHQDGAVIVPKGADSLVFRVGNNGQPVFAQKVTIPARTFVGISSANARDIEDLVTDYLGALL